MDDKKLLGIAVGSSIALYIVLAILLLFYLDSHKVKAYDAASKQTTIELELLSTPKKKVEKKLVKPVQKKKSSEKAKKIVKKSTSRSTKKTSDIKSLFGKTSIKAAKVQKEKVLNIRASLTNSRFRSKFEKEKKVENIKGSNSLNKIQKVSQVTPQLKSNKEKDPYYSKIYEILSSRWQPIAIDTTEDETLAKVVVSIDRDGILFSYTFVQKSGNISFDQQLMLFLDTQINKKFPKHPDGRRDIEIKFNLEN